MLPNKLFAVCGCFALMAGPFAPERAAGEDCTHGMVASVNPIATKAGLDVLKHGGNAIDATVAVALTLGVVDSDNSGIGGGCFLLIRRADGSIIAIDGREKAPGAATRNMFVRDGKADTQLSQTGALASGVPGSLAAYEYAAAHYGKMPLNELILPAAQIAEDGFRVDAGYARRLELVAEDMGKFSASRKVFFRHGSPIKPGKLLKQPDLADTYRAIARQGSAWFYRGHFARAVEKWMKQNGGLLTAHDFEDYQVELREPLVTSYREYQIVGFPPPSSGGVHVAQILNILEHFDLKQADPATRLHLIAESMKLAFADRAHWLGDPDFAKVPRGLISRDYAAALASKIDPLHVSRVASHGLPPEWERDLFKKHTTHFSVADAEGNWVACTATVNTSFGSKVVIPGTGVVLNNQMDDFSIEPGVTNFFGLIGGEANAVEPGKRPLSSMSPTLVLKGHQPVFSLGAAGGPRIISAVVVELICLLDLGRTPAQAVAEPRIHQQWFPDELVVEKNLPEPVRAELVRRGHHLKTVSAAAISQIVGLSGNVFLGASDPRTTGSAEGW